MRTKYCVVEIPMATLGPDLIAKLSPSEYYVGGYRTATERLAITLQGHRRIYKVGSRKQCVEIIAQLYSGRTALPVTDLTSAMS